MKKLYLAGGAILLVIIASVSIFFINKNNKINADLISISNKLFEKHMSELTDVPEKKNIDSSYTITDTKIIAGDSDEFAAKIYYDLSASEGNDTEFVHCIWEMRIKKDSSGKYKLVSEAANVNTNGLKKLKVSQDKVYSNTKLSLDTNNKYAIRGTRISVTYDNGKKWADVPVQLQDLIEGSKINNLESTAEDALEDGSYYITPQKTAFIYGGDLNEGNGVKVIISDNGGKSWYTVSISGPEDQYGYDRKFIGFTSKKQGYIVLTGSVAMGHQENYIFETNDGGRSWVQIGNTNKVYARVVTCAGFETDKIGFVGFRYENDNNPTVYRTDDKGSTWQKVYIKLPGQYASDYATPLCPLFKGANGILPVKLRDSNKIIQYVTSNYGVTWKFDKEVKYSNQKR